MKSNKPVGSVVSSKQVVDVDSTLSSHGQVKHEDCSHKGKCNCWLIGSGLNTRHLIHNASREDLNAAHDRCGTSQDDQDEEKA